jgi:hypothetical protein
MNKILALTLLILLFSCELNKKLVHEKNHNSNILGTWYQKKTIVFNEPRHMATFNKWIFDLEICQLAMRKPKEYGYCINNDRIELRPLEGKKYLQSDYDFLFDRNINIEFNDSLMIWSVPDTLELYFYRTL